MTISDLRDFDIVELRKGIRGFVLNGRIAGIYWTFFRLDRYRLDMTRSEGDVEFDIMKVKKTDISTTSAETILHLLDTDNQCSWDWIREEVKEVTIAEIEEKFGCKVKIIGEEK